MGKIINILIIEACPIALSIASLTMTFSKIANILSIISFVMVTAMSVSAYVALRYMQSPEFERTLKNKLMGDLEKKLPSVMKDTLPKTTGPSFQLTTPQQS